MRLLFTVAGRGRRAQTRKRRVFSGGFRGKSSCFLMQNIWGGSLGSQGFSCLLAIDTPARKSKIQAKSRIAVKPEDKEWYLHAEGPVGYRDCASGRVLSPLRDKTFHGVANSSNYLLVKWLPDDNCRKSTLLQSYYHFQSHSFRTSVDKTQNSGTSGVILLWGQRLKREKQHLFVWFYLIARFGSSFRIQIRWE